MIPLESVLCNSTIVIDANDFIWITMGCGVGYFVVGYLCIKSIYSQCRTRYIENQIVIPAVQV